MIRILTEDGGLLALIRPSKSGVEMSLAPQFKLWRRYTDVDTAAREAASRQRVKNYVLEDDGEHDHVNPGREMKCECENNKHFNDAEITNGVHPYGTSFPSTQRVKTHYGYYNVCQECRDTCFAPWIIREGETMRGNPPMHGLKIIGSNVIEVKHGELTVLYSYETPVAVLAPSGLWVTQTHHSSTTEKHINKWFRSHGLDWKGAARIPQKAIEVAASQGTDPEHLNKLAELSRRMTKPRHRGHQPNPRRYPGKFEGAESPDLAAILYSMSMDGTDESEGDGEVGWTGLMLNITRADFVSGAKDAGVDAAAVIMEGVPKFPFAVILDEDANGFVTYEVFGSDRAAQQEWKSRFE